MDDHDSVLKPMVTWGIPHDLRNPNTSSNAQGGGWKPIGEVGCCESGMAERSH